MKMQKSVIFGKKLKNSYLKDRKYYKIRDHCDYTGEHRSVAHSICNLEYSVPKKIPIVFHNGSGYDYHFIIKESAEENKKQFTCFGGNSEKHVTFTVPKVTLKKKVKLNLLTDIDMLLMVEKGIRGGICHSIY